MKVRNFSIILVMILGVFASAMLFTGGTQVALGSSPNTISNAQLPVTNNYQFPVAKTTNGPIHECPGMMPEPTFSGVSPLSISYVPGMCSLQNYFDWGYGDIAVWQANGHSYVAQSGFNKRMFHLWNVDDPYHPQLLITQAFPTGGTASTAIFDFKQTYSSVTHYYIAVTMRGSGSGCGYFIYNVDNPASPQFIVRKAGSDWCTPHETFVSTDANGSADYAWLTMSGESGSGYKIVALTLPDLSQPNPVVNETGRYQRSDSGSGVFAHDSNVVGDRVFVAHWGGGMLVFDKETLAHTVQPAPLNPTESIRPSNFQVHHTVPTTDGRFAFVESEYINSPSLEKLKVYDISDINNPFYVTGIIGEGVAASNYAHNMIIKPISAGLDLLLVGWYQGGSQGYLVNTNVPAGQAPVITHAFSHQLLQNPTSQWGDVWGVDDLPCTLHGQPHTCIYSSDMNYGLVADALDYDPMLDPYTPASVMTDPVNNQNITGCTYTITGTAHDYYSGVQRVEVSVDGGATWHLAQGTNNWTYDWTIPGNGTYTLQARAVDVAGNVEAPTTSTVVNVTNCTVATTTPEASATNTHIVPTSTSVPTVQATPTRGSACGYVFPSSTTSCLIAEYDYDFTFYEESACTGGSGMVTLQFDVAPSSTGPWTPYDTQSRNVTLPPGPNLISVEGSLSEPNIPAQYSYYRISLTGSVGGGTMNGQTSPHTVCQTGGSATSTPVATSTVQPTITPLSASPTNTPGLPTITPTPGTPTPCPITFSDVPPDNIFYPFIRCLACRGVMGGYDDGTFRPYNEVTRGQTAKMVSNAAGYDDEIPSDRQTFEDVPPGSPFWLWVERLVLHGPEGGIIGGYPCGGPGEPCGPNNLPYFRPYANVTRGQSAKIVSNAAGLTGTPTGLYYADVPEDSPFYLWIMRLTDLGVMSGYDCGGPGEPCDDQQRPYFRPYSNITRGQLAKIIANTWFPNCQTPTRP